jgi:putative colanic acid biosynthesis acetyltransferase WcaF
MAYQRLDKFTMPAGFRGRSALFVQLWWIVQASLFSCSPQALFGWRRFLLRLFGAKIGKNVLIRPTVRITYPWKLEIDDYAWVGDHVELYTLGEIKIGKSAVVSQRSYLCTGSHDYSSENFDIYSQPITIGAQAWVATDVFIHPGVTIGVGAVVGARSTVTEDMPGGMVCVGNPARPIRPRMPG